MYSTKSPIATDTGVFGWLYIAVVPPFFNGVTFTCGSLFVIAVPFTPVMNFLKLKSNSFNVNFSKSSSSCCPGIYSSPLFISESL